jgi:hypothetical protein
MKILFVIAFVGCVAFPNQAQERRISQSEFERAFKESYNIVTIWNGKAFRKRLSVESRSPASGYRLEQVSEFDGRGATRMIYNEQVDGRPPRATREIIGIGNTHHLRDVGKTVWWTRSVGKREEMDYHRAYVPDPFEVQAVRDHFIRSKFQINSKQTAFGVLGNELIKNETATVYKTTEKITGTEKKTGLPMETSAVMKYWFGPNGIILRSESVSTGRIGNDHFFLRIIGVWELDETIAISAPGP